MFGKITASLNDPALNSRMRTDPFTKNMVEVGANIFSPIADDSAIKRLDETYGKMFNDALGAARQSQSFGGLTQTISGFNKNLSGFDPQRRASPFAGAVESLFAKYGRPSPGGNAQATGMSSGGVTSLGGKWESIDTWNKEIEAARQQVKAQTGVDVPSSVIKSVMMIETGGNMPSSANYAGARGLMQVTPMAMGASQYDFDRVNRDPAYSIWAGVNDLALRYQDAKRQNPSYDWSNVATGYFAGHYEPTGASDAWNSDYNYKNMFTQYFNELNAGAGSPTFNSQGIAGANGSAGTVSYASFSGGQSFPVTQELGPTDFAMGAGASMYGYGAAYGVVGHPGIDIGMPAGTVLTTPWAGEVVCVGGQGPGGGGGGCGYYGDVGGGVGRIMIKLDNGDFVIYGHSRDSYVRVGDRVTPGQRIGTSGSMNGDHLHLEYRQAGHNTQSGFKVIDPSTMAGGATAFTGGQQAQQQFAPMQAQATFGGFSQARSFGTPSWYGSYSPGGISASLGRRR